jgi:hypothetical protein
LSGIPSAGASNAMHLPDSFSEKIEVESGRKLNSYLLRFAIKMAILK